MKNKTLTLKEALIDGVRKRGVSEDTVLFDDVKVTSGGWKNPELNIIHKYLTEWDEIIMPGSNMSVLDLPTSEVDNNVIKYITEEISDKGFSAISGLESIADQLLERSVGKGFRPFIAYYKTPAGKKVKQKLGAGTSRTRTRLNLSNDFYYALKQIEDGFEKPLDKLTAQFMNMSGHRGQETARLNIENFLKEFSTEQGSDYGTDFNLHASGWEIKQGVSQTVHFTPLTKAVIYNALEIAKKEGRTSGPLFPDAQKVDNLIGKGLVDTFGNNSFAGYTKKKEGTKALNPTRAFLRKVFKGRIASAQKLSGFGDAYKDTVNLIQGIDMISTEGGYVPINEIEDDVNNIGKVLDDRYIAYSGHFHRDSFLGKNNLIIPEDLLEEINEVPKSTYIKGGKSYMNWMGKEAKNVLLTGKNKVDFKGSSEKIDLTAIEESIKRNNKLDKAVNEEAKKAKLIKQLLANNPQLTQTQALEKVNEILTDKRKIKTLSEKELENQKNYTNSKLKKNAEEVLKGRNNVDLSKKEGLRSLIDGLLDPDSDYFQKFMAGIDNTKTFLSGIQEGAMENYDDQVKAMEANRGRPPLERFMLGAGEAIGMSGRLVGKAARFVKPNIRDVAEREASDITGATAKITNEADQLEMQKQMAAIEDNMANVPEEDVVPETTEEKTQRELSELGF